MVRHESPTGEERETQNLREWIVTLGIELVNKSERGSEV